MKQNLSIILFLLISLHASGQIRFDLTGTVVSKDIPVTNVSGALLKTGTGLRILESGVYTTPDGAAIPGYLVKVEEQVYAIKASHLNRIQLDEASTIAEQWDQILLNSKLPEAYAEYGYQYEIRKELEEEAQEMTNILINQGLMYQDEYIEDYLQSLLNKIQPDTYDDRRPGHLDIKILSSVKPDSYSLPNGTIVISTGLISLLSSEEELIAILTHEVAHYVLDHQITNFNMQVTREKRAAFWGGFATALAAAGEVYMNVNNDIYTGGAITMSTAILSTSIAQSVISRLGIAYSLEQEGQADHATGQILTILHIDPLALSSVLVKMKEYYLAHENYYELSPDGPYPLLTQRINSLGVTDPQQFQSARYDRVVSLVHTHNSILHLHAKESLSAIQMCDRNIESGIALEDDYIIKGLATRQMSNSAAGNLEALRQLQTAESLQILPNINVYKQQGITYMRLEMKEEAIGAFTAYLNRLEQLQSNEYVNGELSWARAMIHKAEVLN